VKRALDVLAWLVLAAFVVGLVYAQAAAWGWRGALFCWAVGASVAWAFARVTDALARKTVKVNVTTNITVTPDPTSTPEQRRELFRFAQDELQRALRSRGARIS
jgi:hypothetical protein